LKIKHVTKGCLNSSNALSREWERSGDEIALRIENAFKMPTLFEPHLMPKKVEK
jgi:hypothetical protein